MGMDGRLSLPLKTRKRQFCQPWWLLCGGICKGFVRKNKKEYSRNSRFEVFPHSSPLHAFGRWDIYTKNVSQKACSCLESRFIVVGGSVRHTASVEGCIPILRSDIQTIFGHVS